MSTKIKPSPIIYLAQLQGTILAKRREVLRVQLNLLKQVPHDKAEMKRKRKEIMAEMNSLTIDMEAKMDEMWKQNHDVVRDLLMVFAGMDFLTRLFDVAEDTFQGVTVGGKRDELLDFVKMCREVQNKANEVVCIIDQAGKEALSMAYAGMEDTIGVELLDRLRQHLDDYSESPEGRKYFYGNH